MNRCPNRSSVYLALPLLLLTACLDVENELAADADGDGQTEFEGDCDDTDPSLRSDTLWARDADLDGFGDPDQVQKVCVAPGDDWVMEDTSDCDDGNPLAFPGAAELDSETVCHRDNDEDGYGDSESTVDGIDPGTDCDDDDASLNQDDADADGYSSCDGDCDDTDALQSVEDLDGDGYSACGSKENIDCDDDDADTFPGAAESEPGPSLCMTDVDDDGWGDSAPIEGVEAGTDCDDADETLNQDDLDSDDFSTCDEDCNDAAGDTFPGAADVEDSDACMTDADGDGWGSADPDDGADTGTDCDDEASEVSPDGSEICDEIDNDCDDLVDDLDGSLDTSTGTSWYQDSDEDGYGDLTASTPACDQPSGFVANSEDCDDEDGEVSPDASEVCDAVDNDCDGLTDDADDSVDLTTGSSWYGDSDGDGYGDADTSTVACDQPSAFVDNAEDCDDGDSGVHPDASEVCDEIDNDCDDAVDDEDSSLTESETWYRDVDGDGYGNASYPTISSCLMPSGYVASDGDCDDADDAINPDATEICDEVDNDCDEYVDDFDSNLDASTTGTLWYSDSDEDGHGDPDDTTYVCVFQAGYVANSEDCDDTDRDISPDATEICDEVDNDCDTAIDDFDSSLDGSSTGTLWYADSDGDGYGDSGDATYVCLFQSGYVENAEDCDDSDAGISPAATEICDEIDNDCDLEIDLDDSEVDGCLLDSYNDGVDSDGDGLDCEAWYYDDGGTYAVCPNQYLTWESASDSCFDAGYDGLATVTTSEANGYIEELMVATSVTFNWIGFNDFDNDGTYTWDNGSTTDYTNWGSGEPSGGGEACGLIQQSLGYAWNDGYCTLTTISAFTCGACEDRDGDGYSSMSCGGTDCDDDDATIGEDAGNGVGESCAATSCLDILNDGFDTGDGTYWLEADGSDAPFEAYCDMTSAGGGWTLVATNGREAIYASPTWALSGGYWTSSNIRDDSDLGEPISLVSSYKSQAFWEMNFSDLMFDTDDMYADLSVHFDMYAVYEDVGDGMESYYDFQSDIPLQNNGVSTAYEWEMTEGNLDSTSESTLCTTNLYIHPCDYDGNSTCLYDQPGYGPTWSQTYNQACPLDDSYYYSFIAGNQMDGLGFPQDPIVWGELAPLRMWAR